MTALDKKIKEIMTRYPSGFTKEWLERTIISSGLYGYSGRVGPYIVYNLNGRMFIRYAPFNFQMSFSPAAIRQRMSMAAANKYAMFIKNINELYEPWTQAKIEGSNGFTKLIKHNKKHLYRNCPSPNNTITPEGYKLYIENLIAAEHDGKFTVHGNHGLHKNDKLIIVMAAIDPKSKSYKDYELLELHNAPVTPGEKIELKKWQKQLCSKYRRFIVYYAIVRGNGKKVQWSNTCVIEGEFSLDGNYEIAEQMGYGQVMNNKLHYTPLPILTSVKPPG